MSSEQIIPVSCNKDCGGGCALSAFVNDGIITRIKDSSYKPKYMRGCIKGYRMTDALYSPDRLVKPLLRKGDRGSLEYIEISWDDALDIVSNKLVYYREKFGASSIMRIGGSGSCRGALHNTAVLTQRFLGLLGGYTETTGNFSSEASDFVKPFMFGTKYVGIDVKTLFKSKFVILWGMNPEETRMGAETENVLKKIAENGIPVAVVDPRKTSSVRKYGADWFPVLPGTDPAFMAAVLFVMIRDSKIDYNYLEKYSAGFYHLADYITGRSDGIEKSPRWAEKICGLPSDRIEKFTDLYTSIKPAALLSGLSVQRTVGGENTDRLAAVLQLASGNFGIPGGSPGCGQWNKIPSVKCGKITSVDNPDIKNVPVYLWADAVIEGTEGGYPSDIKMLYNVGGNYIGQGSDIRKTVAAFEKAEFVVTHDYFLTPSARYSDIIFPAATYLERNDIVFSNSKYLFYSSKVCEPAGESRTDYEIFSLLSRKLGFYDKFTEHRSEAEWLDHFLENSEIEDTDRFKREGIYRSIRQDYIGLSDFFEDPDRKPLSTASGKIEIILDDFVPLGGTELPEIRIMPVSEKYPLRLVTPHEKYRIHSQFDNIQVFKKLTDRTLWINPEDAEKRGIYDSDMVRVASESGEMEAVVKITQDIMPGAVSINQGAWVLHNTPNPNYLTTTSPTLPSRGSRTHSTAVQVERL